MTLGFSGVGGGEPDRSRDWHPAIKNDPAWSAIPQSIESPAHAFHLGAVSLHTKGEDKGPFIATKMAKFGVSWGILYDDGGSNVRSANAQQKKGIALVGIPVKQAFEPGGEPPAGIDLEKHRSASGM